MQEKHDFGEWFAHSDSYYQIESVAKLAKY